VRQGNEVYVIAGVYGEKGKIKGKVTIPSNNWKAIVVLPNGVDDAANTTADARVIAVDMPNINGVKDDDWRKYRTTVRNIEQKTGLNLLSNLPVNVQNSLKTKMDSQ
jgi:endonuclease G